MRKKLLYILPEYDASAPTHYVHIFEFLEQLGKSMNIFLLVEDSVGYPQIDNLSQVYTQKVKLPFLNLFERLLIIFRARMQGYKTTYVHYSYWGAILASLVLRPTGGKVFYWHCEVYDRFFSKLDWSWQSINKKIFDEWSMVLALSLVNFLVTGTKTVGNYYKKQFHLSDEKVQIVPNWVNLNRFSIRQTKKQLRRQLQLPVNNKIVMFAHRLVPRKGADLLPDIISQVVKKTSTVLFLIAGGGGGSLRDHLDREFTRRKLTSHVRLIAGIPNLELPRYLAAADLFIMPSRQEGFPRILIECMATGLPFIAMDVGGTRDILSPNQKDCLIPVGDVKSFVQEIVKLLKTPKELKALSLAGRKQVKKYSLGKVSKQFVNLLS